VHDAGGRTGEGRAIAALFCAGTRCKHAQEHYPFGHARAIPLKSASGGDLLMRPQTVYAPGHARVSFLRHGNREPA
jgi:hypothetical protein